MIVKREKLTFWERLYLPALLGGFKVTATHFVNTVFRRHTVAKDLSGGYYPETPWTVAEGYRGAPYLVRDQDGDTKCVSCQLCEFICPPKAIKIIPGEIPSDPAALPSLSQIENSGCPARPPSPPAVRPRAWRW